MNEYINMWKNYTNFKDRTTRRGYWMATLISYIVTILVSIISYVTRLNIINVILSLIVVIPCIALTVRRLRDAGKVWTWVLIAFVPIVGVIWLIILLCKASAPADGVDVV